MMRSLTTDNMEFTIRRATYEDVDGIYDIMMEAYENLADKKMLFIDDKEFISTQIEQEGFCFVAETNDEKDLAAYLWVHFGGLYEGNLARHMGLTDEELLDSATLDSCCVKIKYRGNRLEKKLIHEAMLELERREVTHVVAKTHPSNIASLKSIMSGGLRPMMHLYEKGTERIVLYKSRKEDELKEFFQLYGEDMEPIQYIKERNKVHRDGDLHAASHIWIFRKNPDTGCLEVLLQKRADNKDSYPGCFDCSSAGHIGAGEEPMGAALRELGEELGIEADEENLTFLFKEEIDDTHDFYGRTFKNHEIDYIYIYNKPVDISLLHFQESEIQGIEWQDAYEVKKALEKGDERYCISLKIYTKVLDKICEENI